VIRKSRRVREKIGKWEHGRRVSHFVTLLLIGVKMNVMISHLESRRPLTPLLSLNGFNLRTERWAKLLQMCNYSLTSLYFWSSGKNIE
jgi:hypothetical protein